jgi:hypothetical protein
VVALLCTLHLAAPAWAQTAPTDQTPTPPPAAAPAAAAPVGATARVEARITELHEKLAIAPRQEARWKTVAGVMRDNARTIDHRLAQRSEKLPTASAVDDLRSYRDLARAHASGLDKLVPAFERLYRVMSADQRRNADAVFAAAQASQ